MKRLAFTLVALYVITVRTAALGANHPTLELDDVLNQPVPHFALSQQSLFDGLTILSNRPKPFALGFESVLRPTFSAPAIPDPLLSLSLENKTVREILDTLCNADGRYTWSTDGSFVNVYPVATIMDIAYLLNRELDMFHVDRVTHTDQVLLAIIRQLPPPKEQIAEVQFGGDASYPPEPWTQTFDHLTVRQAINQLAAHMGPRGSWFLQGSQDFRGFAFFKSGFRPVEKSSAETK